MSQQNIDFGTFPDDPQADAIRTAFQKVQTNFDQLFSAAAVGVVTSVNQTAGQGIQVNTPTGNVVVSANIACVQVATSSLSIGQGGNGGTSATITQSSQTLVIDINPANVFSNNFAAVGGGLANVTGTLTINSNNQPNITRVGTLINLAVTGNTTSGNVYANSGTIGASLLTGTLTTAAQPNITSVGTLTSLIVTGNLTSENANLGNTANANYFAGDGSQLTNVRATGGTSTILSNGTSNVNIPIVSSNVTIGVAGTSNVMVITSTGANIAGTANITGNANVGNLGFGSGVITGTGNITTGNLIGTIAAGSNTITTTGNANVGNLGFGSGIITGTGNIITGNLGFGSGVITGTGNIITGNLIGTIAAGSNTITTTGNANVGNLGFGSGVITGTGNITTGNLIGTFANGNSNINIPSVNGNVNISAEGNANILVITGTGANVTGTANITGNVNVGSNVIVGYNINATTVTGTLTTNAQPNITSVGTLISLAVTGNITSGNANLGNNVTANYFTGSGNNLSNIQGSNITGQSGNALLAGTVYTNAQPNITSVGTLTSLIVSGNISGGNISGGNTVNANYFTGTLTTNAQPNITSVGTLTSLAVTGNITSGNANLGNNVTANYFTGTLTTNAQPNITSVGTLINLSVTGNITSGNANLGNNVTANYFIGSGNNLSNIQGSNVTGQSGNALLAGTVYTNAQPNITSVGTLTSLIVSGNLNASNINGVNIYSGSTANLTGQYITTVATGTPPLVVTSITRVANLNVANAGLADYATVANNVAGANVTGQVNYANIANNIAGANVSGTVANATNSSAILTNVQSIGTYYPTFVSATSNANYTLTTNTAISVNLSNGALTATTFLGNFQGNVSGNIAVGGSNTQILFNDSGNANATAGFTFNKVSNLVTMAGNLITANANLGNAVSANYFIGTFYGTANYATNAGTVTANAQPNITSVGTLTSLAVTGNITSGNANLGNTVIGNYFIGSGNNLSNIQGSNVTGAVAFATTANSVAGANVSGQVANALVAGTVYTNSQPNITSVGTLTGLNVTGSANLGNLSNITITGGGANYFLMTNGSGVLTWTSATLVPVTGSNTQVMFNDGNGQYAGSANFTFNKTTSLLSATLINGTLTTAAQPNVTSVGTLTSLIVNGNINALNVSGGNAVTANYFIGNLYGTANAATNAAALQQNTSTATTVYPTFTTSSANGNSSAVINTAISANLANGSITATTFIGNVTGNISGNIAAGGSNTQVLFNDSGNANATAGFTFNKSSNLVTIAGNLITSNANLGNAATANYFIGSGNNLSNIQGSNVSGQVANSLVTGTVYTAAQPNITSVGTLTSLTVSGNANTGNLGTNNFIATGTGSFSGNLNMNTKWINNVGYPSANTDVATKLYVDTMVSSGISYHSPVNAATTTTLAITTGGTTAYNSPNGASNGIGAYISTTGTFTNIDGVAINVAGRRILVKDEANAIWNGVYTYTNATAITRSADTDEYGPDSIEQLSINDYFFVQTGTVNAGVAFIVSAPSGVITFGTSNITFSQFSTSQVYTAGTGLTLTGTTFSVNASQTQITTVGTLGSLTVTGNIGAGNVNAPTFGAHNGTVGATTPNTGAFTTISATGQFTSTLATGTAPFVVTSTTQVANLNVATSGTVTTSAQPNITSVGTLTSLGVNGTVTAVAFTANTGIFTGNGAGLTNINGSNVTGTVATTVSATNASALLQNTSSATTVYPTFTTSSANGNSQAVFNTSISSNLANASITATTFVGALSGAATTAGTVTTAAQPNITSVGTLTSLSVTGTTTADIFAATNNGNGTNFKVGDDGWLGDINISDTISIRGQQNAANGFIIFGNNDTTAKFGRAGSGPLSYTGAMAISANITTPQFISNVATGTAPLVVTSTTQVANLNVASAGLATYATTANSVAGANVTGAVAYATTANSVAGANVSGAVPSASSVTNSITFNTSGGAAAGTTFNGSAARTIDYSTVGAPSTTGTNASGTWGINISGRAYPRRSDGADINFYWSGQSGQPTWLWGGSDGTNMYVYNPSNFSVNYATSAGSATTAGSASSATTAGTVTTAAQPNITSVGTLSSLSVSGNISGGNVGGIIRPTAGSGTAGIIFPADPGGGSGDLATIKYYAVTGETTVLELTVTNDADDIIKLNATGGTTITNTLTTTSISAGSSSTAGTITGNWSLSGGSRLNATYADLAEYYKSDTELVAGDVVVLGGEFDVTLTEESHDHRVAGIVSTNPAYLMNRKEDETGYVAVALTGRVPCKVIGPVRKGDLLVSSSQKGVAQKLDNTKWVPGCVIGKAMENVHEGLHTIEVAVGRF